LAATVLGIVAAVLPIGTPRADALGLFVGACAPTLTVSFSPTMTAVPHALNMSVSGSGTCVVNGSVGTVSILGGMNSVAWSCEGGVAVGAVGLGFHVPVFEQSYFGVTIVAENVGGLVTVEMAYDLVQLDAVGEFVQLPVSGGANCATGLSSTTWTGAFAFNDPTTG